MSEYLDDPTILLPVNAADPEEPPPAIVELLHPHRVIVLGYYPVPDQASPEQFQDEYETEATDAIAEIAGHFDDSRGSVESIVVFTRDREETIDRVAAERGVDAVLTAGDAGEVLSRVLVPLKGDVNIEPIVAFVGDLLRESEAAVTLYHVADSDEDESRGEFLLRGACDRLEEDGLDPDRIGWEQERAGSPASAIATTAEKFDLIVVGESNPTLRDRILGAVTSQLIVESTHPVLVVRSDRSS